MSLLRRSKPFRPYHSREQINEQEQRNNGREIDHRCNRTSYSVRFTPAPVGTDTFTRTVITLAEWHDLGEYAPDHAGLEASPCGRLQGAIFELRVASLCSPLSASSLVRLVRASRGPVGTGRRGVRPTLGNSARSQSGSEHVKFAASSVLPVPLYFATRGYTHRGRVRSTCPAVE